AARPRWPPCSRRFGVINEQPRPAVVVPVFAEEHRGIGARARGRRGLLARSHRPLLAADRTRSLWRWLLRDAGPKGRVVRPARPGRIAGGDPEVARPTRDANPRQSGARREHARWKHRLVDQRRPTAAREWGRA